jgi:ABC-type nitrate/sulfonate/bicarbonate transport system permease component
MAKAEIAPVEASHISELKNRIGKSSRVSKRLKIYAYNMITLGIFLLAWAIIQNTTTSSYFPTIGGVEKAAVELATKGDIQGFSLIQHAWASSLRVLSGFGLALVMGVTLGLLMGLYPSIYENSKVIIEPVRFIPPIAWIPMAMVLLRGFTRYVFIIWVGAFFPIFISVLTSIPRVETILKDSVKVYGGSRWDILKKIVIPSVTPEILAGARIGLGDSWMCIVAAEMIGGEPVGVGRLILKYADLLNMNAVVVGMILVGVIGLACNEVVLQIERRLFRWRSQITL